MHGQAERSSSESYFWPVIWAVAFHVLMFAMLFVSFAMTPELPPSRPIVQATLYQLKSQSQATVQTNQKIAGEAKKTKAPTHETEQLEQKKNEQEKLEVAKAAEQKKANEVKKAAEAKKADEAKKSAEQKKLADVALKKKAEEEKKKAAAEEQKKKKAAEDAAETFKPVLAKLKEALKDKAEDVRVTSRLVDSPACLVVTDDGMSMQLARMLKQAGQQAPEVKPVLEVNPEHALVKKLDGSVHFHDLAHILFDQALLAEGGLPEDPAAYVKRVNALLS